MNWFNVAMYSIGGAAIIAYVFMRVREVTRKQEQNKC
jgi:hypothetical protein